MGFDISYTNLTLSAAGAWLLYRERGDAENRTKELKYDMQSFFGAKRH